MCGSVARGTARPGSDLDLRLYWRESRPFVACQKQGVMVEQHGHTLAHAEEQIERADLNLYAWTEGRILHDPDGELARLQARARELLAVYQTPETERRTLRHWLASALAKLEGMPDDLQAAFLVQTTIWKLAEGVCAVNNRPSPPGTLMWELLPTLPVQPRSWLEPLLLGTSEERADTFIRVGGWLLRELSPRR